MEWAQVADYISFVDQKFLDRLIKIDFLVKVEAAIRSVKSRFSITCINWSDVIWFDEAEKEQDKVTENTQ